MSTAAGTRRIPLPGLTPPRLFILPVAIFIFLLYLLPNITQLAAAFTDWSTFKGEINFVGLRNFIELAETGELTSAIRASLVFAVAVMIFENLFTLGLALALEKSTRVNAVFRTIFFLPVLISAIATGHAARAFLAPHGFLNSALSTVTGWFGGDPVTVGWLVSPTFTILVLALVHAWKFGGIHMMVYLAGLASIPEDLTAAARIDGAGAWQIVRHVKIPLLVPAFTVNITLTFIGALSAFDVIYATTRGGPGRATEIYNMVVLRHFGSGLFGFSTAMSVVLVASIMITAVPLITYLRRREVEL